MTQESTSTAPPAGRETAFFAAANTEAGFVSRYPALFCEGRVDRLYVIKGGPGTGKSRFMRNAADYAAARGRRAIYLYCSSDPSSLDGVILYGAGKPIVGLLDGTPPHAWEPARPGVREELIDLGAFWDSQALRRAADGIGRLADEKAAAYRRVYACLGAAGQAARVTDSLTEPLTDTAALRVKAERLIRGSLKAENAAGAGGACDDAFPGGRLLPPLFRRAIGMGGVSRTDTLERHASRLLYVGDAHGSGSRFMEMLYRVSAERGLPVLVTHDPLRPDHIDGLLWTDTGLCVLRDDMVETACMTDTVGAQNRTVDLRRYLDAEGLRRVRPALREAAALKTAAVTAALHGLAEVREAHFGLEAVYAAAMDFAAKERFSEAFCKREL